MAIEHLVNAPIVLWAIKNVKIKNGRSPVFAVVFWVRRRLANAPMVQRVNIPASANRVSPVTGRLVNALPALLMMTVRH